LKLAAEQRRAVRALDDAISVGEIARCEGPAGYRQIGAGRRVREFTKRFGIGLHRKSRVGFKGQGGRGGVATIHSYLFGPPLVDADGRLSWRPREEYEDADLFGHRRDQPD